MLEPVVGCPNNEDSEVIIWLVANTWAVPLPENSRGVDCEADVEVL